MSIDTKLFLALLAVLGAGLALVAVGLGMTTRTAMVGVGLLLVISAWRGLGTPRRW